MLLAIFTSCQKSEQQQKDESIQITFNLSAPEDSSQTKATIDGINTNWTSGDKIGFFTSSNSNKEFATNNTGKKAAFSGSITSYATSSYIYFAYPMTTGSTLDASNYYTFTLPSRVDQPGNATYTHLNNLLLMAGQSMSKVSAGGLSSYTADENAGNIKFHYLTAKMDFIITNNTGSSVTINEVYMVTTDNSQVFSTTAKIKMQPDAASLTNYPNNASDFVVSSPTDPSLSVRNTSPTAIANGESMTLSTMFFPVSIANGKQFFVDVITTAGTHRITKTIGGTSPFSFLRGKRYKTLVTLNSTTQSAGTNIYPGTPYSVVAFNFGGSVGSKTYAPVNMGYIAVTRPYGLLYQWHRKYGQDKTGVTITAGPVSLAIGNDYNNRNIFYTSNANWCSVNQTTWSMTDAYNPCPPGWKVPTKAEMEALLTLGYTSTNSGLDGQSGIWIGGNHATDHVGSLFLPNGAARNGGSGDLANSSSKGIYWVSESANGNSNFGLGFDSGSRNTLQQNKSSGYEIRCVKL